jgi:phosphomannomutase
MESNKKPRIDSRVQIEENDADASLLSRNHSLSDARLWAIQDPNPVTKAALLSVLQYHENNNNNNKTTMDDLIKMFDGTRIAFGTAGLRSYMGLGPKAMNDLVVAQTAQGIAKYIQQTIMTTTSNSTTQQKELPSVYIGYDHRRNSQYQLSSLGFARITKLVFQTAGFPDVVLFRGYVATPLVAFAVRRHNQNNDSNNNATAIGIMVTASHNPKQDAGYKIYWYNGCQINSPLDKQIAESIQQNLTPWIDYGSKLSDCQSQNSDDDPDGWGLANADRTQEIIDAYYRALLRPESGIRFVPPQPPQVDATALYPPKFCYSAMHGIGYAFAKRAFREFGMEPPPLSVPQQQDPDPDFSTVPFPNPEERGALDLAQQYAIEHNCDIVLANDPDADRLAVSERDREKGTWTTLTGDQIGVLLGHWCWQLHKKQQQQSLVPKQPDDDRDNIASSSDKVIAMCASTVSSQMLAEIARVEGFHFEDTLTGFKWIGSRAAQLHGSLVPLDDPLSKSSPKYYNVVFCYEEAIGFCCGNVVFDKDGISAMMVLVQMANHVYSTGKNIVQHLQSLYDKYGEFVSNNGYFVLPADSTSSVVANIFDAITHHGAFDTLDTVGPYKVSSVRYLGEPGYDSLASSPDKKPSLPCSKTSPVLTVRFENGCVAQFRASGTEPKFKYYVELKGKPGQPRHVVAEELEDMSQIILDTLLEPDKNQLKQPSLK